MTTEEDVVELIPLDQIKQFDLPNGLPCFVGDIDNICSHIEAHGYSFYYVMCVEKYNHNDGKVTKASERPAIFKVVNTIISRSVTVADPGELGLDQMTVEANYKLPAIPYSHVQMMDDFFRAVEAKHGTESIVLLTYDPDYLEKDNPSEGWGILVPDQVNTAADCLYDHESIAQQKEEHVYVVGSAHSHPAMSAFASGTDHKDQADFPGIHITYGWRKSHNNNATEYYIELQTPGGVFTMEPSQVFESFPKPEPSPVVNEWMEKVSKKAPVVTPPGYSYGNGYSSTTYTPSTSTGSKYSTSYGSVSVKLPAGFPDPVKNTIVAELKEDKEKECPFCLTKFIKADYEKRRCLGCHNYIMLPGETLNDICIERKSKGLYSTEIDIEMGVSRDVYIWRRGEKEECELFHGAGLVGGVAGK